jgi:hypothetical protein
LISNELKIICKVLGEIYTPIGYRGEGVLSGGYEPVTSLTDCHEAEGVRVHSSIVRGERKMICNHLRWGQTLAFRSHRFRGLTGLKIGQ